MSSPSSGQQLGSRNPFLGLLTPQSTGAPTSNSTSQGTSSTPADSSQAPSNATPRTSEDRPAVPEKDQPSPPRLERQMTGALNSSSATSTPQPSSSTRQATVYAPPPGSPPDLPPRAPPSAPIATVTSPDNHTHPARSATLDLLEEELPPAYTPGPDALHGERSVDFGPVRPFQNQNQTRPSPRPAQARNAPSMPGGYPGLSANSGYSGSQGSVYRSQSRGGSGSGIISLLGDLAIAYMNSRESPARTPTSFGRGSDTSAPGGYGRSVPSQPSQPSQPSASFGRASSSAGGRSWNAYPGQMPPRSVTPEARAQAPNDGKPTARPIPGHPLLRDNKVLVYPLGYECRKCFNKGFRPLHASTFDSTPRALAPGDPSHPCKHCWRRYARAYTAAMAQLDWNDVPTESNYQRPISDHFNLPTSQSSSRGLGERQRDDVVVNSASGRPAVIQQQYTGAPASFQWMSDTPTGRIAYEPGDPRIGGRLCMRCHGSGRIRIFILDSEICPLCRGIGRTFY